MSTSPYHRVDYTYPAQQNQNFAASAPPTYEAAAYPQQGQPMQGQPVYPQQGQPMQGQPVIMVAQPQPIVLASPVYLPPAPCLVVCPNCHQTVTTRVVQRSGILVWASCAVLAVLGCFLCCLIPFCIPELKDTEHFCPNCNAVLGGRNSL